MVQFWAEKTDGLDGNGLLKAYVLSIEDEHVGGLGIMGKMVRNARNISCDSLPWRLITPYQL